MCRRGADRNRTARRRVVLIEDSPWRVGCGPQATEVFIQGWGLFVKSQGEIEAAVCDGISRFQQEFLGRGPRDIHAHLIGSLLVVRLQGVLTPAERQLLAPRHDPAVGGGTSDDRPDTTNGHDNGNGRALLKQVRNHMVATGRPRLEAIVEQAVGGKLVSVHHDISTITGEEVLVFSLAEPPACRPKKKT